MLNKSFSVIFNNQIKNYKKSIYVDSDKSISIRSFLIGAISHGKTKIKNVLESDDVFATIGCLRKLGVKIKKIKYKEYEVYGKGLGSLHCKKNTLLKFYNSGTLARLIVGILSTTPGIDVRITGDNSLKKRNMSKLIDLMNQFGAQFYPPKKKFLPLRLISSALPVGITYEAGVSAQLKSAVMLAGANSFGTTTIFEKKKSRDHTENMLLNSSKIIKIQKGKKKIIQIFGKNYLKALDINVPGDCSAAAFFTALTLMSKNSELTIKNVGFNSTRRGFYELLKKNGAKIFFKNQKKVNNEKISDIYIKSGKLKKPIIASSDLYERMPDEYPILFCIAAFTNGISKFNGIEDLANKESNRIKEMQKILKQIGIKNKATRSQLKIFGKTNFKNEKKDIEVKNLGDHRICMSAAIVSLVTGVKAKIKNFETVNTSSPSFLKIIKYLGGKYEVKKKL